MKRSATRTSLVVVGLLLIVVAALYGYSRIPTRTPPIGTPERLRTDAATLERGRYLVTAGDCVACHSMPDGKPFAGGLALDSPIGQIYSTNITPDRKNGIGNYTLEDFDRVMRYGIDPHGDTVYPAMPYPSFARMSPDDIAAMYAYLMHGLQPIDSPNHDTAIRWPFSARWPLAIWRKTFAPDPARPVPQDPRFSDPRIARGAYLVEGPGHCGSCHTPRAITLQEKALDDSSDQYLRGGGLIDGWVAVNLRGDAADGLGNWSEQDIVASLRTGRNANHAVIGTAMTDVVYHSLQYLTDDDLGAMAAYLKTLKPVGGQSTSYAASDDTANALRAGINDGRGAELYADNCSACHSTSGLGREKALPAIAGNSSVLQKDPTSMIKLLLAGSELPSTRTAPSALGMPKFAWRLSDDETAQLLTFIRNSWGNHAPTVSASAVSKVRKEVKDEDR